MTALLADSLLARWRSVAAAVALPACLVLTTAVPAKADAVLDWNAIAESTSVAAGGPPIRNRITAMVQVAVHDALNSIEPRYDSYAGVPLAVAGASPEAAVAAAAYTVLIQTVPSQASALGRSTITTSRDCPPALRRIRPALTTALRRVRRQQPPFSR
jgi:hypothetical protein